jgi:membrane protease YdiL (CAAX protease family)
MSDLDYTQPELAPFSAPEQTAITPTFFSEPWVPATPSDAPSDLFQAWTEPISLSPPRIPHLGHLALLAVFAGIGFVCATVLMMIALHFHLFGVTDMTKAATEVHYILGTEAVIYLITFSLALFILPLFWKKSFFAGIHWRGAAALQMGWSLPATALGCFALAWFDERLLPGPEHTPIDEIFRSPGAAWLMFAFGVTVAPFFEEMIFRGFLLPAIATACDWIGEYIVSENEWSRPTLVMGSVIASTALALFSEEVYGHHHFVGLFLLFCFVTPVFSFAFFWIYLRYQDLGAGHRARPLDNDGHPQWSIPSMVIASIAVSLPFALMHAEQTGHSLGPFLLLVSVSLVLCAVRLKTRSLAASTMVHACYNFLIFFLMLISTEGFRHLDKM